MPWERVGALSDLRSRPITAKFGRKQIAVFYAQDQAFAVDNRCPHEGYPLAQGTVDSTGDTDDDCVLTCNWHNWKFQLRNGKCILGGDDVRSYPTRCDDEGVWVNTDDPPPEVILDGILNGLHGAYVDRDFGRICREIARLHYNGFDPLLAVRKGIEWSHDKLEFGTTHAYAAAADWLTLYRGYEGDFEKQLICLGETVDHMAFDALRQPTFPYPVDSQSWDHESFLQAVELQDSPRAEALAKGAIEQGLHWRDIEGAFADAALAHYNDFGHSLIYVYKTRQLIEHCGEEIERYVVPSLARSICYATREDLIPEFNQYRPALQAAADIDGRQFNARLPVDCDAQLHPPFPASLQEALRWTQTNAHQPPSAIYDAMLRAAAENLLHYDESFQSSFDRPVSQNVGWLSFTHAVTFANAVRVIGSDYPSLAARGLLQLACFLGRNRPFIDLELQTEPWRVEDESSFIESIHEAILDHGMRDPIFSAHLVKTAHAAMEEFAFVSRECKQSLLNGLNRLFHATIKQKHVRRLARQAIDLVSRDF